MVAMCHRFLLSCASRGAFCCYKRGDKKMNISNMGIEALKRQEGRVTNAGRHVLYDDQTGRPVPAGAPLPPGATIGYGHLVRPGEDFRAGITESAATELLRTDVAAVMRAVRDSITVDLAQHQYDALVMFAYNIGAGAFARSSVVRYVNNPEFRCARYPTLRDAWYAWNRSGGRIMPGLVRRREYEFRLFTTGAY